MDYLLGFRLHAVDNDVDQEYLAMRLGTRNALSALERRRDELIDWLATEAHHSIHDQHHLEDGSSEQTYWHYGYLIAIQDVLAALGAASTSRH